jgi:hypothetical protein
VYIWFQEEDAALDAQIIQAAACAHSPHHGCAPTASPSPPWSHVSHTPKFAAAVLSAAAFTQKALQHSPIPFCPFIASLRPVLSSIWLDARMIAEALFENVSGDLPVLARPDFEGFGSLGGRADNTSNALRFPALRVFGLVEAAVLSR